MATATGSYKLLAVPDFDGGGDATFQPDKAAGRFRSHLEKTKFRPHTGFRAEIEDKHSDDDGAHRIDVFYPRAESLGTGGEKGSGDKLSEIEAVLFHQHKLMPGDAVCVIGHYSASRGGIVPPSNGARMTRILAGDPGKLDRTFSTQIRKCLILALMLAACAVLLVKLAVPG